MAKYIKNMFFIPFAFDTFGFKMSCITMSCLLALLDVVFTMIDFIIKKSSGAACYPFAFYLVENNGLYNI